MGLPGQEQARQPGGDRQRDGYRHDHRVAPAAEEYEDHERHEDRGQDRLVDDVFDRSAYEHRLVEIELELEPLRRVGLDVRQEIAHGLHDPERRGIRVLQDAHVACALSVDAHGVLLGGEAVADFRDVPELNDEPLAYPHRQAVELLDHLWAGIEADVELALTDARDAGRHDHIGGLQGADDVHLRQALGGEPGRVDVNDDLALLAAIWRRDRDARDGEQADAQEIQTVVEDLLLRNGSAVQRDLHHRHVGRVEADHVRRRDPGRGDTQDRVVLRRDLRDGAADVGALVEIDLEDAEPRDRHRFDALDPVDRGRVGALADEHDAPLLILGGEPGIVPGDIDDRDVDVGKDIHDDAGHGQEAAEHDEHRGNRHGVRSPQGEAYEIDHGDDTPGSMRNCSRQPATPAGPQDMRVSRSRSLAELSRRILCRERA
jgi:hypothetical protein